jgi:hypothetical protein
MENNKHIWEGWTIQNFIDYLEPLFEFVMTGRSITKPFQSKEELKKWCMDTQPYYKKHIPGVFNHFKKKAGL